MIPPNNTQAITDNPDSGTIIYTPSELITLFTAVWRRQPEFAKLVWLTGVYKKQQVTKQQAWYSYTFGSLRNENSPGEKINLWIRKELDGELVDGNVVTIGGFLHPKIKTDANVQLSFVVTRIERQRGPTVDPLVEKRTALLRNKQQTGFRNVDGAIERKLLADEKPVVALIVPPSSITLSDFESELRGAKDFVEISEVRSDFNPQALTATLHEIDGKGFDVIAVMRGGGSGLDNLDDLAVLETLCTMKTPVVAAVGHSEERIWFKELVDKEVSTPAGLGKYLSDLVEHSAEAKTKSKALLLKQVGKQYEDQIADLKKRLDDQGQKHQRENTAFKQQLAAQETARKEEREAHQRQLAQQMEQQSKANALVVEQLRAQATEQEKKHQSECAAFKQQLEAQETGRKEEREAYQRQLAQQIDQQSKANALMIEQLRTQSSAHEALLKEDFDKRQAALKKANTRLQWSIFLVGIGLIAAVVVLISQLYK